MGRGYCCTSGCSILLPVSGPGFRGQFCRERTQIRSQIARAGGPGDLGPDNDPFAIAFWPKPAQNQPRKPGTGAGSTNEQPKVDRNIGAEFEHPSRTPVFIDHRDPHPHPWDYNVRYDVHCGYEADF